MDFDDLLVRTVNLLELFPEVRERYQHNFQHVLVDEYQDTNHAQYRLLQLLTSEHGNLMVVGDEDQSIYGFRHADIRNILDFERDFPEADVVKLEQNYRSTQTILSAANAVVEHNRERRPKRLWTEVAGGEPVQLNELSDEHEEARWVAGEIERLAELEVDSKRYPPRAIRAQISGAKNQLVDAKAYAEKQGSVFEEVTAAVFSLYEKRMLAANAMDFDDLLVRMVDAMEQFEEVRERWRRTFRQVLVDEYQDTNHAQYRLLQLLCAEHGNLMVVGDEDQSIYGFRHADIRNILDFEQDFPEAEIVKLEQNYRSTQTILSAANAVVERNRERRPKRLWTDIAGGEPVQLSELADEHEEARWVAGEIERLAEEEGVKREDVAVFYRTNAMSRVLEDTLVRFELPYQVIGGTKFYERAEIKDAIAYLSLLANPSDQVSFARVVNSPRRGIGNTTQGRLASHANTTGLPIWEVAGKVKDVPGLGPAAVKAISRFHETMQGLIERAADGAPVATVLEATLRETGYIEALEAERTVEAEGRIENLEELIGVASEFDLNREAEGDSEVTPLEEFLQQISLYTAQDDIDSEESLITLMTLHNAKGLEYDTVFIVGCEDGALPHMRSLEEGGEEEERRLCYVGITRARRRLYMTWARERRLFGRSEHNFPSRFIDELPAELTERHTTAPAEAATTWTPTREPGAPPIEPRPALQLHTGDDVVHASFGEGVVTGVEPGGVVVVRFAADGTERKL
ncbi:MAG TPA: 3'-5' exonuclease, partial [Thermoanaerobaculia bacterium]